LQTDNPSGPARGVGLTVVNALSERLEAEIRREGRIWRQEFKEGRPTGPIHVVGLTQSTGTKIRFLPDGTIFNGLAFDALVLEKRLRELGDRNQGIKFRFTDKRPEPRDVEF
jgi:DNA gyrase subunit B